MERDRYNVKGEWIAADDAVTCVIYAKDHGLLETTDGWKRFCSLTKRDKLVASYEHMFGSKPNATKIASPLAKGDHPEIDESAFLEEKGMQQCQSLIGQLQWATSLGRFDISVAIMTMSSFRSAPREGQLD